MRKLLLKLVMMAVAVINLSACGSSDDLCGEPTKWIAAYPSERLGVESVIRIEATDTLLSRIDTLRSLRNVFRFTPSVKGEACYVEGGRFVDFLPKEGALKQGKKYTCRVSLKRLTGIDSLKDAEFEFVVERRETKLSELHVAVDAKNAGQVVVSGEILFSCKPTETSLDASRLSCGIDDVRCVIEPTEDELRYRFMISGVERRAKDYDLEIEYNPKDGFSRSKAEVVVPGVAEFKLLSAKRCEGVEPYINLEFSAPLDSNQELDGLITIDRLSTLSFVRTGANVKLYYQDNAFPEMVLRVSELLRAEDGRRLKADVAQYIEQEVIPPAIDIPISGTILPDGTNLKFPFRSVNLAAVDVEVVKIYAKNVLSFLQESRLDYTHSLRHVGRLIHKQTVRLDSDKSTNLHKWQNFSIDLKDLFKEESGAIYNIRLSFRKAYSLYNRAKAREFEEVTAITPSDEKFWNQELDYVWRKAPDYNWETYNWQEQDDPAKDSYYMVHERMPEYNLMASNIGLIVKRANSDRLWCSVSDIMTTQPKGGVLLTAYNYQLQRVGSAYSNEEGFADFQVEGEPFVVVATKGGSATYLKLGSGRELSTSRFDVGGKRTTKGIRGFVYGERGVWRPGDEIHLTLIVEDRERTLPKNHPVTMELYTPLGQLYSTQSISESVDGMYVFNTSTPNDAPTGSWSAKFKVGGEIFDHKVRIETIKPNRLKINIQSPDMLQSGDEADIAIEARWLTGPVAAGMRANVELSLLSGVEPFEDYRGYTFSNPLNRHTISEFEIFSDELDSLGRGKCQLRVPETQHASGMLQANLIVSVEEPSGDESVVAQRVKYSPYKSYVGVDLQGGEFETDDDISLPVVVLDPEGRRVERSIKYKIYHLDWSWWWEGSEVNLSRYVESESSEVVESGELMTSNGRAVIPFRVEYPEWGKYLIYVEEPVSGHATGGVIFVDWPDWRGRASKSDPTSSTMLSFSLDKRSYEVGESAMVYLPKSDGGRVLLSVESSSGVVSRRWVQTSADSETPCKIAVTKEMTPNFYVHATLLQPHAKTINGQPIRLYGIQGAQVVDRRTILHPVIDVAEEILPQQEFTIAVSERDGKPMSYTLAIVDEGLLDITSFKTPQPWAAMNQREALGVSTWDIYNDVIGAYGGRFTSILSVGGDEALRSMSGKEKRFNPVVKFMGPFTINKGVKSHKVTLPMYVGSVRVMVVAAKGGAYGSADRSVAVRSPLMLIPTLPRRVSCGDRVEMPVNIFALEQGVGDVRVEVHAEGAISVGGESSKLLHFTSEGEKLERFNLVCDDKRSGWAKLTIVAEGGGYRAMEVVDIEVCNPMPEIVVSESVVLEGLAKHKFELGDSTLTSATLTIATMPTIDFGGALSFVENYMHLCTEQLSARAMYMLYARRFLSDEQQKRVDKLLPKLLERLSARQLQTGGFTYWLGGSEAHEWATSMAGEVLVEARRQGYAVSTQSVDRWLGYQGKMARRYRHAVGSADDLQQAYRLYTMILAGKHPAAMMNKLRESKYLSKQAALRLAAAYTLSGRTDVAAKLLERSDMLKQMDGSYNTFWSPLRDKAMALESWLLAGDKIRAIELAEEVANEFSATWSSTQELAFVSVAMSRMADVVSDRAAEFAISSGANRSILRDMRGVKEIPVSLAGGSLEVENLGSGELYGWLSTTHRASIKEGVKPSSNGVAVDVHYTDRQGRPIAVDNLKQGSEFIVQIDVKVRGEGSQSFALSYEIPSGWEIWNNRLFGGNCLNDGEYVDVRDERISWYFTLKSGGSRRFAVRLRATYSGEFILPSTICEDMYRAECRAMTESRRVKVRR